MIEAYLGTDDTFWNSSDVVGGYGEHHDPQRHDLQSQARRDHDCDRPERRRQVHGVQSRIRLAVDRAPATSASKARDITHWSPARVLDAGICYVPQGRNIFPELSVRHNIELGACRGGRTIKRYPGAASRLRSIGFRHCARKANQQASTLSGGEQKQLEIVRGLLLDPKLVLIDEPSIGLSPKLVQELLAIAEGAARRAASPS